MHNSYHRKIFRLHNGLKYWPEGLGHPTYDIWLMHWGMSITNLLQIP